MLARASGRSRGLGKVLPGERIQPWNPTEPGQELPELWDPGTNCGFIASNYRVLFAAINLGEAVRGTERGDI